MKEFSVLLTCSSFHAIGIVDTLKNNPENCRVSVYVANCNEEDLPPSSCCDGTFVVPKLTAPNYINHILFLCKEYSIDIIMPTSSLELVLMAKNKDLFNKHGVIVSVSSLESLSIANNKIKLWKHFKDVMPSQQVVFNVKEARDFIGRFESVCCKPADLYGGKGFAVIDDENSINTSLFHAYGKKHYISHEQLYEIVEKSPNGIILQEYHKGADYMVSVLAENGRVLYLCGYWGDVVEFGAVVKDRIADLPKAYEIAEMVVQRLGIDGNVGFDFIVKDDGTVLLLDVNLRINATLQFPAKAGCNLSYLRCKRLLGDTSMYKLNINRNLKMVKYFDSKYYE